MSLETDERSLVEGRSKVVKAIEENGFRDFYFIGINAYGARISSWCIGEEGPKFALGNCERMDRMIGAISRQLMQWQINTDKANSAPQAPTSSEEDDDDGVDSL